MLELDCGLDFDAAHADDFFSLLPPLPAVCLVELRKESAQPLLIRTQDLRRRLQRLLGLRTPIYAHLPVLVEADGSKLAKSARSVPLQGRAALPQLLSVFDLLGLAPPASLATETVGAAWTWAIAEWDMNGVGRRLTRPLAG